MRSNRSVRIFSISIACMVTIFVGFLAYETLFLSTRYSVNDFFPKNHPILDDNAKTQQRFQLSESPNFFVALSLKKEEAGHWLTSERVAWLSEVTDRLSVTEGVKHAQSLSNLEVAIEESETLKVGPLLQTLPADQWVDYVRSHALVRSQLISGDMRSVLILVEPAGQGAHELADLEGKIRDVAAGPQWEVSLAGVPAVQARLTDRLGKEIVKFLCLSLLFFCLMFLVFYRNWSPLVFAAGGLIVANVTSLGWLSSCGVPFTILLSTLPIIVSITFVSLEVHTLHLWADRSRELFLEDKSLARRFRASLAVLRELALPNFLGSLTTAIGFLTLALADIPMIRTYALVVSGMVMWTWFITQILLLGFMHFLNPVARSWNHTRAWWMLGFNRWSFTVIALTLLASASLGGLMSKVNFSGRLFDDLPRSERVRKSTEQLDRQFGGTVGLDFSLNSPDENAWKDPGRLQRLKSALQSIRKLPGVGSALSVTDFLGGKVPRTNRAVAETYFLFSMAAENPLRQFLSSDFREVRVAMRLRDLPTAQIQKIREWVRKTLETVDGEVSMRETGLAVNSHTINQEVAKELVYGFWQSLVFIGLLLMLVFRSVRWAVMACLPNLVPPAILIGTLALLQTPVKPGIALVFSIALGLAFNNTVYLLSRLKRMQGEFKMQSLPLRRALLEEGNPCFSESFIMLTGFVIFLTSDFKLNQTFGAYMILSILAGALADLVFLPAVLRRFSSFLWARPAVASQKSSNQKTLLGVLFLGSLLMIPAPSRAAVDPSQKILEKARAQLESHDDQAKVKMKIIESNGENKTREMTLQTLRTANGVKALIRIQAPADIKGTAFLSDIEGKEERQWLYLPSTKQVRRVATTQKSTGVLGSELSPEDLNPTLLRGGKIQVMKQEASSDVLEMTPAPSTSEYSRILVTFSKPESLPLKTEYYVGSQLVKTVEFLDYKAVGGKIQRAQLIRVKNLKKNRGTDLELSEIKVNANLSEKNFNESALKADW